MVQVVGIEPTVPQGAVVLQTTEIPLSQHLLKPMKCKNLLKYVK